MRAPDPQRAVRCAIYTRKSTEDGLEQAFNSLDAQREACAAYVLSQRHEGWVLVPGHYDDGGFSGGSMERPGLQAILAAVRAGKVDVIIVYKVDRLTRSLADFAKIVEVLDGAGASFVSITQAFNTTTSMGRLTLNVLLSFAQFEREVTGERIRDKIAASKKKGLWMGGPVPLGYEVKERKLVVHEAEAATVRHIFQRYLDLSSVRALIIDLRAAGIVTKVQARTSGPHRGGIAFARGSLYHLLKNPIYLGQIVHKGVAHPGEHPPIVPTPLWEKVQARLTDRAAERRKPTGGSRTSVLAGLLYDGLGRRMSPSHTVKGSRRYRYYITHEQEREDHSHRAWRVPAHDVEELVVQRLTAFLSDSHALHAAIEDPDLDGADLAAAIHQAREVARQLESLSAEARADILRTLIRRVDVHDDRLDLTVDIAVLHACIEASPITISSPASRLRRKHAVRIVLQAPEEAAPSRDQRLIKLVADGLEAREAMLSMPGRSLSAIARAQGRCPKSFTKLVRVGHLAPDIATAILEGRQPPGLTRARLLAYDLPVSWEEQRLFVGISSYCRNWPVKSQAHLGNL